MMNILILSNCQGTEILKYLNYCKKFNSDYENSEVIMPHWFDNSNLTLLPDYIIDICKKADLLIYQPMSLRRGPFETETDNGILKYFKSACIKISFPSLYSDIFPVYFEDQWVGKKTVRKVKGLNYVQDLISNGVSKEDIIRLYDSHLLNFHLKERLNYCLRFMLEKEQNCNIKASTFIEQNLKKIRLFDTQNHPTEKLLGYISNEILKCLNYTEIDYLNLERFIINGESGKFGFEDSIYMKKELNLEYLDNIDETNYKKITIEYIKNPELYLLRGIRFGT
jgi:hypothetical protein